MTRSCITLIKSYQDPEQLIRCNRPTMNTDPLAVINLPQKIPLFDDPRGQVNIRKQVPMEQKNVARTTTIQMIKNRLQFKGNMMEDPNKHLKRLLQLYDTFKYNRVSNDVVLLWLFPFSLYDNATDWLDLLE
ncbi:RING-H2 finger protein ATL63 [Gossypium australe]|uniref:RING-H2 finger protein ATL63 n=1 Tax=Gossypium australe TaxID=47621 RepID=A0A5B6VVY0_9ROSI|nr:RING-H2 finger protein ATL63 [Gossypium australe]